MTEKVGTPNDRRQDEWQNDLNPNPDAGQNHGANEAQSEKAALNAYEIEELHETLKDFASDELKDITVLAHGERLKQGATYLDLMDSTRQEFTAMGNMEADAGHYYVPKTEVSYELWNRLTSANH
ncbi:hypothetical protein IFO70_06260 [Phormidium tenue FACHB-886]|nr:hypothetical protein [Phormidium tenue FACHB-886]